MGCRRGRRIPWHVTRASLPLLFANPFRALRDPFPMKRAMAFRQVQLLRSRSSVARPARDAEPKPLYPQLDVSRFLGGFGLDSNAPGRGAGEEQARSLKAVLGSSRARPAAVFGVGLGVAAQDVAIPVESGPGKLPVVKGPGEQDEEETTLLKKFKEASEKEDQDQGQDVEKDIKEDVDEEDLVEEETTAGQAAPMEKSASPPWSPLPFNISSELFHAARAAPPESPESFWCHTMYRGPRAAGDESTTAGRVEEHYCTTRDGMESICRRYFVGEPVLGFDMEWMFKAKCTSSARENISVIQLASPGHVALFHIARFPGADGDGDGDGDLAAPTFRRIMADPGVSKAGVNILADCTRLKNHLGVDAAGIIELSHLYKVVKYVPLRRPDLINKRLVALATQVQNQLGLPLFKGDAVRTSNWMDPLNEDQKRYAASDVYASLQLYHVMESKRQALDPCPARPFPAELRLKVPVPPLDVLPQHVLATPSDDTKDTITKDLEALTLSQSRSSKSKPKSRDDRKSSSAEALLPKDPRVLAADLKIEHYRTSTASTTRSSSLRAYYLWADDDALTPESIASLLRDPPLQASTVAKYILDAMSAEKLPFDAARARKELRPHIHPHLLKTVRSLKSFPWDDQQ